MFYSIQIGDIMMKLSEYVLNTLCTTLIMVSVFSWENSRYIIKKVLNKKYRSLHQNKDPAYKIQPEAILYYGDKLQK